KDFEKKIKKYMSQIEDVSDEINKNIQAYEEAERQKRLEKIQTVIDEMSENYNVSMEEIEISNSWLNKTSFTAKGEPTKKIIEEIASVMTTLANEKERIEND
ncbi:DUF1351 domain-containing protein, partial [Enterococcus faecalis]